MTLSVKLLPIKQKVLMKINAKKSRNVKHGNMNALTVAAKNLCGRGSRYYGLAYELLRLAVKEGDHEAQYALGTWYLLGRHVEKDENEGVRMLKKAVKLGSSSAMYDLAVAYEKGIGISKNIPMAFKMYLMAAVNGDLDSCEEVARCYYHGIGTEKSIKKYEKWSKLVPKKT